MDIDVDIEKQIAQLQEGRLNGTIKPIGNISIDPDLEYCATIVAIFVVPISIAVIVLYSIYANLSIILNFALLLLGFCSCS